MTNIKRLLNYRTKINNFYKSKYRAIFELQATEYKEELERKYKEKEEYLLTTEQKLQSQLQEFNDIYKFYTSKSGYKSIDWDVNNYCCHLNNGDFRWCMEAMYVLDKDLFVKNTLQSIDDVVDRLKGQLETKESIIQGLREDIESIEHKKQQKIDKLQTKLDHAEQALKDKHLYSVIVKE